MIAVALVTTTLSFAGTQKVIYGEDNRRDLFEVSDTMLRELSRSTAAMMSSSSIRMSGQTANINARSVGSAYNLCKEEAFYDQPAAATCSGFLVGPKTLVTAGHCIKSQSACTRVKFVFDFATTKAGQTKYTMPKSSVYSCKKLVKSVLNSGWGKDNNDYAVIELDREVTDRSPLKFRKAGKIEDGEDLVVMGHPTGIPLKIADGAYVRKNNNPIFFTANLDTYGGNSGSAVFNMTTGEVEGILVRGDRDYVQRSGSTCRESNICPETGCAGESVTRITNVNEIMNL
jgi:V8-like Glu-specific endopeptidase